jgi:hypothetical protein
MTTLDVTILADSDEPFVMSILGAMAEKKLIRVNATDVSIVRPGSPLSVAQLNQQIEKSERSGRVSVEDAKKQLGV